MHYPGNKDSGGALKRFCSGGDKGCCRETSTGTNATLADAMQRTPESKTRTEEPGNKRHSTRATACYARREACMVGQACNNHQSWGWELCAAKQCDIPGQIIA